MTSASPDIRSLRIFGFLWALVFSVIGLWPLMGGNEPRFWALVIACIFVLVSVVLPTLYARSGMYRGWVKVGEVVGHINSRIIMFLMFFVMFAPVGLLFRIIRRDVLHKRFDPQATSYFVKRETQPDSMKNQF